MILTRTALFNRGHRVAAIALLALAASGCGHAAEPAATGALHAERAWLRATPPNAPVSGGFVTLRNAGSADDRLLSVSSPAAQRVEIHEMRMDGGTMRMRQLTDGVPVAAGKSVELMPGAMHLMFIGPARAFKAGERVEATFVYAHAGRQQVSFAVQPLTATTAPAATEATDEHAHH